MEIEIKKLLYDILNSINDINSYIGKKRKFEDYRKNGLLKAGVERKLEIIGEAMSVILKICPDIKIKNARRAVDARNKIIHGYNEIEDINIWAIIINHLPILKAEVENLLENAQNN